MPAPSTNQESQEFAERLSDPLKKFGINQLDGDDLTGVTRTAQLRRLRRNRIDDESGIMTLLDDDGVLRWRIGSGPAPRRPGRRGLSGLPSGDGRIVAQFKFSDLPPNLVGQNLRKLDDALTGVQGLFEVPRSILPRLTKPQKQTGSFFETPTSPPKTGRVLLLVHGTFSNCENLLYELASTDRGIDLLKRLLDGRTYSKILAFNHPTLSVSPILNAVTLANALRDSEARVDIICHSRGGLVTRWWLEALDSYRGPLAARGSVVFAGSPLAGTGLAAPRRLKAALEMLTNVNKALTLVSNLTAPVVPFAHAAGVLFSMFGKITSFAANSPLLDAGVSLIPGLAAQSREGANGEILRLREAISVMSAAERNTRFLDRYWCLKSNFEPEEPTWKFWRYFRKDRLASVAADVVFEGDNDLVVDSQSMTDMADGLDISLLDKAHVGDFESSKTVHHCNYFQQEETFKLIKTAFGLE